MHMLYVCVHILEAYIHILHVCERTLMPRNVDLGLLFFFFFFFCVLISFNPLFRSC